MRCLLHCHIRTSRWDWKDNNWPVCYLKSISANNIHSIFTEPKVTKSHMIQSSHLCLFAWTGEMLQSLDNFNNMQRRFINQVWLYFIQKAYLTYIYIPGNVQTFLKQKSKPRRAPSPIKFGSDGCPQILKVMEKDEGTYKSKVMQIMLWEYIKEHIGECFSDLFRVCLIHAY